MDASLSAALAALPPLDHTNARSRTASCKICGSAVDFFDVCDFNKSTDGYRFGPSGISVTWLRCTTCSFIFADFFDKWTQKDFERFVYNQDYVKVDGEYLGARPKRIAAHVAQLLSGHRACSILDYGSGSGLFARHMAELGFPKVENYDPFSSPKRPVGQFDIITCFEVVEHSPDPLGTFLDLASFLKPGGLVMLGTALQPPEIGIIRTSWWYAAPRNGHLSLYSDHALAVVAGRAGLRFHPGGQILLTSDGSGPLIDFAETRNGPPLFFVNLGAPKSGDNPAWHGVERGAGGPFRWTASTRTTWTVDLPPGSWRLRLRIPIWAEARPDAGKLTVNGESVAVRKEGAAYVGQSESPTSGNAIVVLELPELYCPHEHTGGPDKRQLGIAISIIERPVFVHVGEPG
jgi:2-polyprenyl-6-hydroxyphenyl methylase/3-demethylubiquinone-9 3-methyltransferase